MSYITSNKVARIHVQPLSEVQSHPPERPQGGQHNNPPWYRLSVGARVGGWFDVY